MHLSCFFFYRLPLGRRDPHSFPTRRSSDLIGAHDRLAHHDAAIVGDAMTFDAIGCRDDHFLSSEHKRRTQRDEAETRSEEHTSELQSRENLVCRLLLEKKKEKIRHKRHETN